LLRKLSQSVSFKSPRKITFHTCGVTPSFQHLEIRTSAKFIRRCPVYVAELYIFRTRHLLHDPWGVRSDRFIRNSRWRRCESTTPGAWIRG